jgi:tetratricopeptide (TPR) repeat protein
LAQWLLALPAARLVLFFDDLQWADHATLEALGYVMRRLRDRPLLVAATVRTEDAGPEVEELAAGWQREGVCGRVIMRRLEAAEAGQLALALHGDEAPRWVERSGGNPYFLIELCRAGGEAVPGVLADLVRARLGRLGAGAQQVLQAAAVLEPAFDFPVLRRVSGRDEAETLDALDALLRAGVLVERGSAYAFAHPLVGSVVREGLSAARGAFLHRRAAEALEAAHAGWLEPAAGRLAEHYARAGQPPQAARFAELAGAHALGLAAFRAAADFYRRALAFEPTPGRLLGLGRALYRQGEIAEARAVLQRAQREFMAVGDRTGALWADLALYDSYLRAGHIDEVLRWAASRPGDFAPGVEPAAQAFAYHLIGAALLHARRPLDEAEHHLQAGARLAAEHDLLEVYARCQFGLASVRAQRGDLAGAVDAYRKVVDLARAGGDVFHEALAHNNAAYHALLLGDLPAAHAHVAAGLALAEARGLDVLQQWLFSTRGEIALAERQWEAAENWFERGLAEAERFDNPEMSATYRANLGLVSRGRGRLPEARRRLEAARQSAPDNVLRARINLWLAEVALDLGDQAGALSALERAEVRLTGGGHTALQEWAERVRAAVTAGPGRSP